MQAGAVRWRAIALGLVAAFMTLLDVSIVNVAIPTIQASLHVVPADLQWVLSGYTLAFGLLLVPSGRFGDARGRRTAFVAGLAAFTLSSAAAGLARSPEWLIIARLGQGAAAGTVNPQVTGLIQQLFQPVERGRPFGMLGATVGISTAVGPLLGGAIIELAGPHEGWRWVFYINVPVGIAAMVLGWRWIPGSVSRRHESLDPVGMVLLGAGVVALLLPLVEEQQWHGRAKWLLVPLGAALLAAFAHWERRCRQRTQPLVDLELFRLRSYRLGALVALLYFAGFTAIFVIFTLYLQSGLHYSALAAGLATTPFALGFAGAAALGGRLVNRVGRVLVAIGLATVATGLVATVIALHFVPGHRAPLAAAAPLLVAGLGSGLVITPNQALSLAEVPVSQAGIAGGMLQTGQRIGGALGIAGVGSVFFARLAGTSGHWATAFRSALVVAIGFILLALVAALIDLRDGRHRPAHQAWRQSGGPHHGEDE
jgi:EmrB/QacA subfamily drug resistance transporter